MAVAYATVVAMARSEDFLPRIISTNGILGTADDNTPFLHPDGSMSTWYDADGDGTVNANFNYSTDINMDASRANKISGYPKDASNNPLSYNSVATDNMGTLEGVFYTNHAVAMRLANANAILHGSIISRNEQIIFQQYLTMIYDSRIHSRYANNPNSVINLGLPDDRGAGLSCPIIHSTRGSDTGCLDSLAGILERL